MRSTNYHVRITEFQKSQANGVLQALFRRGQLKALVDLHSETEGLGGQLAADEINVIRGALDLTNKTAAKGMTPLNKVSLGSLITHGHSHLDTSSLHLASSRIHSCKRFLFVSLAFQACKVAHW